MLRAMRSELTRMRRRGFLLGWLGLTAIFTAIITTIAFQAAADGSATQSGPGPVFPTAAELALSDGLVGGLAAATTLLGVVTLAYWAVATATDYSSGMVRLLVQAQPRRARLIGGKALALIAMTAVVTTIAVVVDVMAAPAAAGAAGISTEAWQSGALSTISGAWLNTFFALVVWGAIGLVIAVLTRSAAVAISIGVGYVIVAENVVALAAEGARDWLPGATLTALAEGGTATISYGTAIALGATYFVVALGIALVVFRRRDIVD